MPTKEEVVQQILEILEPMMTKDGSPAPSGSDLISDLGLESLEVMRMIETLEDNFDISIPINILPGISTVADLAVEIQKLTGDE
jgi:acyl carrier protein